MSTKDKIAEQRAAYLSNASDTFEHYMDGGWVESPIEQLSLAAMLANGWEGMGPDDWNFARRQFEALGMDPSLMLQDSEFGILGVQVKCKLDGHSVRFDAVCLMTNAMNKKIVFVIEFDGHEFHERNKKQAAKDKARDRAVTRCGWVPLRFSGSEVYEDPECLLSHLSDVYVDSMKESTRLYDKRKDGGEA